jgi:hypothetical protein
MTERSATNSTQSDALRWRLRALVSAAIWLAPQLLIPAAAGLLASLIFVRRPSVMYNTGTSRGRPHGGWLDEACQSPAAKAMRR